jgi:hypothetical protein
MKPGEEEEQNQREEEKRRMEFRTSYISKTNEDQTYIGKRITRRRKRLIIER